MKFLYEYRTSDNEKHRGTISASDKEAAYAALKRQGIRPSRFAEAPGFFNKLFGKGKRWMAIGALCVLCLALCVVVYTQGARHRESVATDAIFDSGLRRQVIGDAGVIAQGIRTGWADVFALEGDRFLASFAIPGVPAAVRSTTEEEIYKALQSAAVTPEPSLEGRQIIAIVAGMKDELREFLADGGTVKQYGRRLVRRQEEEISYYNRAKTEVERAVAERKSEGELLDLVSRRNAALRKLGIKLVVLPE